MVSPAVGLGRVHEASFTASFRFGNDVSVCNYCEVIITSGFAVILTLLVKNVVTLGMQ